MMKKITKLLTVVIMAMLFLTPSVKAVTTITTNDAKKGTTDPNSSYVTNQATLTVNGVAPIETFAAYKVLDVYYNSATNVITYEFTTEFKAFLAQSANYNTLDVVGYYALTNGDINSGSTRTPSTLDKLASAYAAYIKNHSVTGAPMTVTGTTATVTADAGSYLVLPTSTPRVFAVMVGNLEFTAEGSAWNLNNATINAKVSDAGVSKSVAVDGHREGSFVIGDEFSYIITATVPTYPTNATNKKYTITDTFDSGITFSGLNSISVTVGGVTYTNTNGVITNAGKTVATATIAGQVLTIDFNVDNVDATTVVISYKAKLNNNAVPGQPNTNKVKLTYSNDPYGDGTEETDPETATDGKADAYTYGLEILVHEKDSITTVLEGGVFDIYSDSGLTNKIGTITSGANGLGTFNGLAEGTYYLKETKAPTGYSLIRDSIPVEIKKENTGATAGEGYTRLNIPASKVGLLPSTGGIGTMLYTLLGLIVVISAIALVIVYRKQKKEENFQA